MRREILILRGWNRSHARRLACKVQIAGVCGADWEDTMGDLLPDKPEETFLFDLSKYARPNPWEIAEPYFQGRIAERFPIPRAQKNLTCFVPIVLTKRSLSGLVYIL